MEKIRRRTEQKSSRPSNRSGTSCIYVDSYIVFVRTQNASVRWKRVESTFCENNRVLSARGIFFLFVLTRVDRTSSVQKKVQGDEHVRFEQRETVRIEIPIVRDSECRAVRWGAVLKRVPGSVRRLKFGPTLFIRRSIRPRKYRIPAGLVTGFRVFSRPQAPKTGF